MNRMLKKLTVLAATLAVMGVVMVGLSATIFAQTSDQDAIKAEVQAAASQLGLALNTSDGELFDTLWLHSDEVTYFSATQPFRIEGWPDVKGPFAGLLGLPAGKVTHVTRQETIDMISDDVALSTGHFILTIRPPGASTITLNGRFTAILKNIDGTWLRVHMHTSLLP